MTSIVLMAVLAVAAPAPAPAPNQQTKDEETYLEWTVAQCESIGKAAYQRGRVGGLFDTRLLKTERSYNYKLAATWLTPDVIRAAARLLQIRSRLTVEQTRALVAEAEAVDGTVVLVEIDPREGSGVIPLEWEAFLQPRGGAGHAVAGTHAPHLRQVKALNGVLRRNYDYDRFWVLFPRETVPSAEPAVTAVELIVRIYDKEGRVTWPIPASLRAIAPAVVR
jgi:hypothetical protein